MEMNSVRIPPSRSGSFTPLPAGQPAPSTSPARIREQLGWGLLRQNRR